jgi:hypothetical protein
VPLITTFEGISVQLTMASGKKLADVRLKQTDDIALLEAAAREANGGGPCDLVFGSRLLLIGQDAESAGLHDGAQVVAIANHKVVTAWNAGISYNRLEFSASNTQVMRPKYVSAYPAALVQVDPEIPTSLCFRIAAFPPNKTSFSVGIANEGFKKFFGKGFGAEEKSWGLQWTAEEDATNTTVDSTATCRRRPAEGDVICVNCDPLSGHCMITLNDKVLHTCKVPSGENYVLGATLSTECVLIVTANEA